MNEILIYGEVGFDVRDVDVANQLKDVEGDLTVRINSPGGDVYAGLAIMNALRSYGGRVTAVIDGLAASAASFIAVGGADRVVARPNSEIMIHSAWAGMQGNADDLTKLAGDLNRISANLAKIYSEKTGQPVEQMDALMRAETWFSADEAMEIGLVDAVEDARSPQSNVKQPVFAKALSRFKYAGRDDAPAPEIQSRVESPPTNFEEVNMTILDKLAQAAGVTPDELEKELSGFFNEQVEVKTTITIEYPDTAEVVLTGKTVVEPAIELPEGVELSVSAPDGFTAELGERGAVTVRATDEVKVGDVADVVVSAAEGGEATIKVEVVAADSDDPETTEYTQAAPDDPAPVEQPGNAAEFAEVPAGFALVPQAHLDDLTARAAMGEEAYNAKKQADLEAEVDGWIAEGRFSAARRENVIKNMTDNPELTRKTWGNLPANSIPRAEVGYGRDPEDPEKSNKLTAQDLRELSASRLNKNS